MSDYLLIESRDPFESKSFSQRCEMALTLRAENAGVTLFLVENAVLAARTGAKLRELEKLAKSGVRLMADEFALRERAVNDVSPGVAAVPLDTLIGELAAGAKALWN
jgi:hypothetical protein